MSSIKRLLALITTMILVPVSACAGDPGGVPTKAEESPANCGVVVDSTAFTKYEAAKDLVRQNLARFAQGCGWVSFALITGRSEGTPCQKPSFGLTATEEDNPNHNPRVAEDFRQQRLASVVRFALELLARCEADRSRGSDVLGAFRVISRKLAGAPDRRAKGRIIVFSDMFNNVGLLDLRDGDYSTPDSRRAKVEQLRENNLLPALTGSSVRIYGFNLESEIKADRVPQLEQLWRDILGASGAGEITLS
ncbi:VWA domain-containing protein [Nonomuraea lactucae]|uniref:VWA domain-containing protein n=1 Tax=Nonomuraea lactucae TaxID=2249762 RepID=UPI000DE4F30D|nr:VWA domain-containing protein [Nonomuraea lactucae]